MKNKQAFIASIYIGLSMHIRFSKVTSYGCAVSQLTTSRGASHLDLRRAPLELCSVAALVFTITLTR